MRFRAQQRFAGVSPPHEHWRLRVEWESRWGLAEIADEKTATSSDESVTLEATTIELTGEELRWLSRQLLALIEMQDVQEAKATAAKVST